MVTTCFFCQNLLSDYLEGILPSIRHEELRKHLTGCKECSELCTQLEKTINVLHTVQPSPVSTDLKERVTETSHTASMGIQRLRLPKKALFAVVPIILFFIVTAVFPTLFPFMARFRNQDSPGDFVRYFPLLQGAGELIEDQTTFFGQKDPFAGSLWEEGGLSPDEFEKTFQKKSVKGDE